MTEQQMTAFEAFLKRELPDHSIEEIAPGTLNLARNAWAAALSHAEGEAVDHWAVRNPGLADQFRAEAQAVRKRLGFESDADDVSPNDLRERIAEIEGAPQVADGVDPWPTPFAYCFTDVNGRPTEFTDGPEHSAPEDKRVITALYTHPAPQVAVPEGWSVSRTKAVLHPDAVGFIIRTPTLNGVKSSTCVWLDDEDPAHQMLAIMLAAAPTAPAGEQPVSGPDGLDRVLMPRALTAENGAKTALMGEFDFSVTMTCPECHPDDPNPDCEVCAGSVEYEQPHTVPWTTIKRIYAAAVDLLSAPAPDEREIAAKALDDFMFDVAERVRLLSDSGQEARVLRKVNGWLHRRAKRLRAGKEGE